MWSNERLIINFMWEHNYFTPPPPPVVSFCVLELNSCLIWCIYIRTKSDTWVLSVFIFYATFSPFLIDFEAAPAPTIYIQMAWNDHSKHRITFTRLKCRVVSPRCSGPKNCLLLGVWAYINEFCTVTTPNPSRWGTHGPKWKVSNDYFWIKINKK